MERETAHRIEDEYYIRHKLFRERKSPLQQYLELVLGESSLFQLVKYELITMLLGPIPGAVGLLLRKIFYPFLLKEVGEGVVFGRNIVIRHPDKIRLGNRVIIDDDTFLDARGAGEQGIVIEDDVIINRSCYIQAKVGPIHIGGRCDIGTGTTIVSQGGVHIDEQVAIAGGCKISGGLFKISQDEDASPPCGRYSRGPVRIERRCLLAMGAVILDGVTVGEGTMVGAGTVVSMSLPRNSITSPRPPLVLKNPDLENG